jgi:hypothetical protein
MPNLITVNPEAVLDAILDELERRNVLSDSWQEVFGVESFAEVVARMEGLSVTRPTAL